MSDLRHLPHPTLSTGSFKNHRACEAPSPSTRYRTEIRTDHTFLIRSLRRGAKHAVALYRVLLIGPGLSLAITSNPLGLLPQPNPMPAH
jgi:hypothetical protein